ncbi:MAG: UDP-glucose 4-epimerase [Thermoleophilaceae bacterium]|nr:UDP-glucose 4-epimerase [Thermoleophilaceae bacterium]
MTKAMTSRRVLITGLSTYWGGRLAQALEAHTDVEAIIGVDNRDPKVELERTEFVRVTNQHGLLRRIVDAAEIDTVVDSRLVVDSTVTSPRKAHENNVIGTMNLLAACSGPDSTVRKFVFKSSAHYYGAEQDDPAFFTEAMGRPHPPRTRIERDIAEAESTVADFAEKNPDVGVAILRFANVLGPTVRTAHSRLFSLPVVPMILGFDPRYQFVHEDDVVTALEHVVRDDIRGIYNVAADGVLALTEVVGLLGKTYAPILPPWGTGLAAATLSRVGIRVPPEMLQQMRFGRGVDNRKLKATGFRYRYTTRETVLKLAEHQRLHPIVRGATEPYRYEREVEDFLRWSPNVRNPNYRKESRLTPGEMVDLQKVVASYGDRVGSPAGGGSKREQSQAVMRAASGTTPAAEEPAPSKSAIRPRARRPKPSPKRAAARAAQNGGEAPVDHYDDLKADEIVTLIDSLEPTDLDALLEYERANRSRPRVVSAIEGARARRESGQPR